MLELEDGTTRPEDKVANGNTQHHGSDSYSDDDTDSSTRIPLLQKSGTCGMCTGQGPSDGRVTSEVSEESSLQVGLQVFFPFLIAGFGMVGAGVLLDIVQVGKACWLVS